MPLFCLPSLPVFREGEVPEASGSIDAGVIAGIGPEIAGEEVATDRKVVELPPAEPDAVRGLPRIGR